MIIVNSVCLNDQIVIKIKSKRPEHNFLNLTNQNRTTLKGSEPFRLSILGQISSTSHVLP